MIASCSSCGSDVTKTVDVSADRLAEIRKLLEEREEFYGRCDFSVDTSEREPLTTAGLILEFVSGLREQ